MFNTHTTYCISTTKYDIHDKQTQRQKHALSQLKCPLESPSIVIG